MKIRRSCVTVQYQLSGEPIYHIDFAVYAASNADGKLYIAKGKEHSDEDYKEWELSDPKGLMKCIANKYEDEKDRAQFRRVIRYLKKWRNMKFSSSGNSAPTGIALTVLAYENFKVSKTYDSISCTYKYSDFDALSNLIDNIESVFSMVYDIDSDAYLYTISVYLPVEPYGELLSKMTAKQKDSFYQEVVDFGEKLNEVESKSLLTEKCTVLQNVFGEDFPIKTERSVTGSSESA